MNPNDIYQKAIKALGNIGQKVVNTPVLPFLPQSVNLKNIATRPPGTFTPLDPGSLYGNLQQDPKGAIMNTVMALSSAPVPAKDALMKISNMDRKIMGDFVEAIESGKAKQPLDDLGVNAQRIAKGLGVPETATNQTIANRFNNAIKAMDEQGIQPVIEPDSWKAAQKVVQNKPSTGGEIGGISKTIPQGKYKTTLDINNENDMPYLKKIFSEDQIKDMKSGKMTNWRGTSYEDMGRVNIVSGKPTELIINDLNPTGGLYVDYTPQQRMKAPLGENITTLDKTMNKKPDEMITIYRGVSKPGRNINPGDFITTSPEGAKGYGEYVLSKKVKLSDILDDKREPLGGEYLYRPSSGEISKGVR